MQKKKLIKKNMIFSFEYFSSLMEKISKEEKYGDLEINLVNENNLLFFTINTPFILRSVSIHINTPVICRHR